MRKRVMQVTGVAACAVGLSLGACSDSNDNVEGAFAVPEAFAVGTTSMTLVDTSRPTAAHGAVPEQSTRTIATVLLYPAEGVPGDAVTSHAPVEMVGAPFPLIVLSHGLGESRGQSS